MARGSLVLPVLLIGIGVLFLLNNLRPDVPLFELVAGYWPFVLVAWGVLRLAEILISAARSRPLPRAGISGGEWALAVLICLVGSGTHFAKTRLPHARITMHGLEVFGKAFDFPVSGQAEAGEAPQVFIENLYGNVRLAGGDTSEVRVEGRTTVRAFDVDDARKTNEKCPLEVIRQADQIVVRTNQSQAAAQSKINTDLDITVPKGATVICRGREGDVDVTNVSGNVEVDSDNAGVRLTEIGGDARVALRRSDIVRVVNLKGSVHIEGSGDEIELASIGGLATIKGSYSGDLTLRELAQPLVFESKRTELRVERVPGEIRMDLGELTAEDVVGPVQLRTSSRDVRFFQFNGGLNLDIERGDVELWPGTTDVGEINVALRSGDIELALPESADASVEATAERGEAINEYGSELAVTALGDQGGKITGPAGKPLKVKVKTSRGKVTVRRATAEDDGSTRPRRLETTTG